MRFVLVHSPAVGPTCWRWVAEALRDRGHHVSVPNLMAGAGTGDPRVLVEAIVESCRTADGGALVGHSGAGMMLPLVADQLDSPPRLVVFVDAGVPPCDGVVEVGGDFLRQLRALATGDVLPRWSTWFGEGVLETLVPQDDRRRALESELPQIPLSFYEAALEMPPGWCARPAAYLLLSEAYRDDASRASSLGWPVVEQLGGHLDIVTRAEAVAGALAGLLDSEQGLQQ